MEDDWESAADREVVTSRPPLINNNVNKWEGEDEDEDIKDSWEDEEEKKDEEKTVKPTTVPAKTKPNKALKAKLAEQERLAEEEEEKRLANMTAEEKLAEKLRMQKIQEESDLKSALETFGITSASAESLDSFNPQTKEDFKEFGATLSWKLAQYKESPHFPGFIEELVRSLCVNLSAADIKKVKINVETLHSEKLKLEKQSSKKPVGKGKAKATLRTEADDIDGYQKYGNDFTDDYDDFM